MAHAENRFPWSSYLTDTRWWRRQFDNLSVGEKVRGALKQPVVNGRSWPIVTVSARAGQQPFRVAGQHEGVLT